MTRRWVASFATLRFIAILSALLLGAAAFAHATLVLGTLRSDPAVPRPGEPFSLTLELLDPTQAPVEDASVLAEFRQQNTPEGSGPVSTHFEESGTAGVYRAQVTLLERGVYALLLRDQTYRQEEAQAELTLNVGRRTGSEGLSFIFPPTATGPQSLTTWLGWLIGLPLVAAVVVTVLVLTRGQSGNAEEGQPEALKEQG